MEPRFCPHLMLSEKIPEVTARHVVQTVLDGLQEGENLYGVKVRYLFKVANLSLFKNGVH